jgi:hypothetical protein
MNDIYTTLPPESLPSTSPTASATQQTTSTASATAKYISSVSVEACEGVGKTYWAEHFQQVIALPVAERAERLSQLFEQFKQVATSIAAVIFQERHNNEHERAFFRPNQLGQAGGLKYFGHGIFFKLAHCSPDLPIYSNEEMSVKAAGHELHGLNALMSCGLHLGIAFPLMVCTIERLH